MTISSMRFCRWCRYEYRDVHWCSLISTPESGLLLQSLLRQDRLRGSRTFSKNSIESILIMLQRKHKIYRYELREKEKCRLFLSGISSETIISVANLSIYWRADYLRVYVLNHVSDSQKYMQSRIILIKSPSKTLRSVYFEAHKWKLTW